LHTVGKGLFPLIRKDLDALRREKYPKGETREKEHPGEVNRKSIENAGNWLPNGGGRTEFGVEFEGTHHQKIGGGKIFGGEKRERETLIR